MSIKKCFKLQYYKLRIIRIFCRNTILSWSAPYPCLFWRLSLICIRVQTSIHDIIYLLEKITAQEMQLFQTLLA